MKSMLAIFLLLSPLPGFATSPGHPHRPELRRIAVREVVRGPGNAEDAFLSRPAALAFDKNRLYIADAEECAVKVFTKEGRFVASHGRKGQGPGEFSFPSGVSVRGGRIYVADKFNFRIQTLDLEGAPLGGFRVPFAPDKVFALEDDVLLVTHNPLNRSGTEKMLHAFDGNGRLLWQGLESRISGDPVYDAFRNMTAVCPGPDGDFFLIFKCDEREVLHFDPAGRRIGAIPLDERYEDKALSLPLKSGRRTIRGVGWSWAVSSGRFFLLAPAYTPENDLGPGREVFVFDRTGLLDGLVRLPAETAAIAVDGDLIYAIDIDRELRVLRMSER
jgi:hypothetical protein